MPTLISQKLIKKAAKDYACDGCYALMDYGSLDQFIEEHKPTPEELEIINKAKLANYRITKGQPYIRQFLVDGGDKWMFRSIPEIFDIGVKYGFYDGD